MCNHGGDEPKNQDCLFPAQAGPHESVLGREIVPVIQRFLTSVPQRFEVAKDRVLLHGAVIEVDEASGRAVKIERISLQL